MTNSARIRRKFPESTARRRCGRIVAPCVELARYYDHIKVRHVVEHSHDTAVTTSYCGKDSDGDG